MLRCIVPLHSVECVAFSPRFVINRRVNDAFFEHRGQLGELADFAVVDDVVRAAKRLEDTEAELTRLRSDQLPLAKPEGQPDANSIPKNSEFGQPP